MPTHEILRLLQVTANCHEGRDHAGTTGHGCSCGFIVQLGDVVTRGEKQGVMTLLS